MFTDITVQHKETVFQYLRVLEDERLQHLQQGEDIFKNQLVVSVSELPRSEVGTAFQHPPQHRQLS